jgi:hypothetical protein
MGEVRSLTVTSNRAAQEAAVELIQSAQARDPLALVTLVVDTAAQAWEFRRQIVASLPVGSGLANVQTTTLPELLATWAADAGVTTPDTADPVLSAAVVDISLDAEGEPWAASAGHPDTTLRLGRLADELQWCSLSEQDVEELPAREISSTARLAIDFVRRSRGHLESILGVRAWTDTAERLAAHLSAHPESARWPGDLILLTSRLPAPLLQVLDAASQATSVTRIDLRPEVLPVTTALVSAPDPVTECALAVRRVGQALSDGLPPSRIALLFSSDAPYGALLERSLASAEIEWHGPTLTPLSRSATARQLGALLAMARERQGGGSGITRPLLMRWLARGRIYLDGSPCPTGALRSVIRREGLFGDATAWLPHLVALAASEAAGDEDDDTAHEARRSFAADLLNLLDGLDTRLDAIVTAGNWTELGEAAWATLEGFHLAGRWWLADDVERTTVETVRALLQDSLPGIDSLPRTGGGQPRATDLVEVVDRVLASRRGRHGTSSRGIHVGPVAGARGLSFSLVVLVGAGEGLLPDSRGDDPLLPDAARIRLRTVVDDLLTGPETEQHLQAALTGLADPSTQLVATYSRGGLPGRAIDRPSRFLTATVTEMVQSAAHALTIEPPPLAAEDVAVRSTIGTSTVPPGLQACVDSSHAWSHPSPGVHLGTVGPVDGQPAWQLDQVTLSASGIEQFLHCPYHFFVQRVLGISTDEYEDTVEAVDRASLGSLLHTALERFVEVSRADGTLPAAGEPWSDEALPRLQAIVEEHLREAEVRGLTGWEPAWRRTRRQAMDSLAAFLDLDAAKVRKDPPLAPHAVEQRFGYDGEPVVEFRVDADVTVHLRGSIDRVDVSADGGTVGVVDYKTGKSDGFSGKLGVPAQSGKNKGLPREREKVQDLVYDVAARALYPQAQDVQVRFVFVPNGDGPPVVTPAPADPDRAESLRNLLTGLDSAARNGVFPPRNWPQDYCPVCNRLSRRAAAIGGDTDAEEGS